MAASSASRASPQSTTGKQFYADDVYARVCSCKQCWASKCRGL
jgi:hypothetical protein